MSLESEIGDCLERPGWDESIAAVKRVVRNALHELDRGAEIRDTNYFNHSFVPDFVVSWPNEPNRTRDVFLRLDTSREFLSADIRYLSGGRPLLLGLSEVAEDVRAPGITTLAESADDSPVLVTEPGAVEQLIDSGEAAAFGHVVPAAMLKGGRGYVDTESASDLVAAGARFFAGARSHEPEAVTGSAPRLAAYLDDAQRAQMFNFGRIVWEATGGGAASFPLSTNLAGVDDAGLRFLLDEAPEGDAGFWRSIGGLVTLERLLALGVRTGPNLAAFVRANCDRLYARVLLVRGEQPRLGDDGPSWIVSSGALALRGFDFTAYIAPRRDDLTVPPDSRSGLRLDTFRERTRDSQVETVAVIASDGKHVVIRSDSIFDTLTDPVLASVGDLPGTAISSVGVIVAGKHLECDFTALTTSGHTSAQFDVVSLVSRGLPLVWPLTNQRDVDELALLHATVARFAGQPSLFDPVEVDRESEPIAGP